MSGMTAMLAFGYVLSHNYQDQWEGLSSPEWDDEEYEMKWPGWVDPEDPVESMDGRLIKAGLGTQVKISMYGNFNWPEIPVILWAAASAHEADDGPAALENFTSRSTAWTAALDRALEALEIRPKACAQWILAPSVS